MSAHNKPHLGREIHQRRSQLTYEALISTAFRLIEERDLDSITVSELAGEAGYSVGAFYARFHSKDQLLDAMLRQHLEMRNNTLDRLFSSLPAEQLSSGLISNMADYFWEHRGFWRTVLLRCLRDSTFRQAILAQGRQLPERFIHRLEQDLGRKLRKSEKDNIEFSFHQVISLVNNQVLELPTPPELSRKHFTRQLIRTFILSSSVDYK